MYAASSRIYNEFKSWQKYDQYVHVNCLQRWRNSSLSNSAFWQCPQCQFNYRFARTKISGLATNPGRWHIHNDKCFDDELFYSVVVGFLSMVLFTLLVMFSSYATTYFLNYMEAQPTYTGYFFISPIDVGQDLIRAAIRILHDQDILPSEFDFQHSFPKPIPTRAPEPPGVLIRFVRRFVFGLPMIGAASLVHMLLSVPFLGPLQWVARWRGNRSRRGNNKDLAAALIIIFIVIGAARSAILYFDYPCHLRAVPEHCTKSTVLLAG